MAYTKTVWETGDVITAAKLNNAEDGIEAASPMFLSGEWEEPTSNVYVLTFCTLEEFTEYITAGNNIVFSIPAIADVVAAADVRFMGIEDPTISTFPILVPADGHEAQFSIRDDNVQCAIYSTL